MINELSRFSEEDVVGIGVSGIAAGFTMFMTESATTSVIKDNPEFHGGELLKLLANFDFSNFSIVAAHLFREADPIQK